MNTHRKKKQTMDNTKNLQVEEDNATVSFFIIASSSY